MISHYEFSFTTADTKKVTFWNFYPSTEGSPEKQVNAKNSQLKQRFENVRVRPVYVETEE